MERVQFQQEQMLAELKDLAQKGIFSQTEIKQIMKKRTVFETTLVRRIPKKGDFLRYAAYEMSLEALRRKRAERLKLPKGPPSVSDFSLIRRQYQIFERALKKFKDDIGLWIQYIQAAKRENSRALVGRICARALQLHPNAPALYILAASHELKHLSHAAARVLLQRGLRMNPESTDLWREYVKMEMGFAESLRRRWEVLGLKIGETTPDIEMAGAGAGGSADGELLAKDMPSPGGAGSLEEDENARKDILDGVLVKMVITNAVKAVSSLELFTSIRSVLMTYPCPPSLRRTLLAHLHTLLRSTFSTNFEPQAAKLYATRFLTPELEGEALVDTIQQANEDFLGAVRLVWREKVISGKRLGKANTITACSEMAVVYAQFIEEWFEKDLDNHLRLYLLSSLQSLCASTSSPTLLAAHLRLLASSTNPNPLSSEKLMKLAKKYSLKCPDALDVWLFRLSLEATSGLDWRDLWEQARAHFLSNIDATRRSDEIWLWGLKRMETFPVSEQIQTLESLFHESARLSTASLSDNSLSLTEKLLVRYIRLLRKRSDAMMRTGKYKAGGFNKDVERIASQHLPSSVVWSEIFDIYAQTPPSHASANDESLTGVNMEEETERVLRTIFERWRVMSPIDHSEAALKWAGWLVRRGSGREAAGVVAVARSALSGLGEDAAAVFDIRWKDVVYRREKAAEAAGSEPEQDVNS